jgi:hypothetical protein
MTGDCVSGEHVECPDSYQDRGLCGCPCHLVIDAAEAVLS